MMHLAVEKFSTSHFVPKKGGLIDIHKQAKENKRAKTSKPKPMP